MVHILYNNRLKMIKFLEDFLEPERKMDSQFLQDKATVIQKLKLLEPPEGLAAKA